MKTYRVHFDNGQFALIDAESESAVRQCWIDNTGEFIHVVDEPSITNVTETRTPEGHLWEAERLLGYASAGIGSEAQAAAAVRATAHIQLALATNLFRENES